jgi:hypothetical protein
MPAGARLSLLHNIRSTLWPNQPPIQRVRGAISLGAKRSERKADHSPPANVQVKNGGAIPPLPICLNGEVLNLLDTGMLPFYILWRRAVAWLVEALCYKPEGRGSISVEVTGYFFI